MLSNTYHDSFNNIREQLKDCVCNRSEKVQFICIETACPDHHSQPLYCMQCMDDDIVHKSHKATSIVKLS